VETAVAALERWFRDLEQALVNLRLNGAS